MKAVDRETLNSFLWFSYRPEFSPRYLTPLLDDLPGFRDLKKWLHEASEAEAVAEGGRVLQRAMERTLSSRSSGTHLVPLGGGFDSRAILAFLLEAGLRDQIVTCTFGVPHAYDFEFGRRVAKKAGVRHEAINLNHQKISREDLRETAKSGALWTELVTAYYNVVAQRWFGGNEYHWSGFLGGGLAGSLYRPGYETLSYSESKKIFVASNRQASSRDFSLHEETYDPTSALPPSPPIEDPALVSYPEQLNLTVRQPSWIGKTVCSNDSAIPFADPEWIRFMFAAPPQHRYRTRLYRRILLEKFPGLFNLPIKSVAGFYLGSPRLAFAIKLFQLLSPVKGRGLGSSFNRHINYIDFRSAYARREDFRDLALASLSRLEERGLVPWLDTRKILTDHMNGSQSFHRELNTLISLDINAEVAGEL